MGLPTTILSLLPLREFVNSHEMCQMGQKIQGKMGVFVCRLSLCHQEFLVIEGNDL